MTIVVTVLPKKIVDEWTDRDDLTPSQKWYYRNPEKVKVRYTRTNKERYVNLTSEEYELKKEKERIRWAKMPHEKRAEKALKRSYGITFDDYLELVGNQNYMCAGCGTEVTAEPGPLKGVVDHCHTLGHIRGILCNHCNKVLGLVYDNSNALRSLARYLDER